MRQPEGCRHCGACGGKRLPSVYIADGPHVPAGGVAVQAAVTGVVWEVRCAIGQVVKPGDTLLVLEAMKMEFAVQNSTHGRVVHVSVAPGDMVKQGARQLSLPF